MQRIIPFLFLTTLLAGSAGAFAQRYNAGTYSGAAGNYNTYVGPYAGKYNDQPNNTFLGTAAGQFSSGGNNTYLGFFAGYWNSSTSNTFVGYQAGSAQHSTGGNNTFVGTNTGLKNLDGFLNTFVGANTGMANTSGDYNTVLGADAGQNNTTGGFNTFLGVSAGLANESGSQNLFAGATAGMYNYTGERNSFMGNAAGLKNYNGNDNTFVGYSAGSTNTNGGANTFLGTSAGQNNTSGTGNTMLGHLTIAGSGSLNNATAIGYRAKVSASNSLVLGSISGQNGATVSTKVGIGTTAPAYRLHLNSSSAAKVGGGSWTVASDQRLKKDIREFTDGLNVLLQMKPVTFRYNGKAGIDTDGQFVGVIAQQMQQIAPYTVGQFTYQDSTGKQEHYLDYDPNAITYVLVNAVKEQQKQLAQKDAQLLEQQVRMQALEDRLARLEALRKDDGKPASARLYQNQPNPTDGTTTIRYFLPETTSSALLKLYAPNGQEVQSLPLTRKGESQVTLSGGALPPGTYVYQLVVEGRAVDAKKLVLVR